MDFLIKKIACGQFLLVNQVVNILLYVPQILILLLLQYYIFVAQLLRVQLIFNN